MDFFATLGVPAIIAAAISILLNYFSAKELKKKQAFIDAELVKYKNQYDRQLIDYKSGYEKELAELNHRLKTFGDRLSLLNVKRADIINQLYQKLVSFQFQMHRLASGGYHKNELQAVNEETTVIYNDYVRFLAENKLYFSINLSLQLEKISMEYLTAFIDIFEYRNIDPQTTDREERKEGFEQMKLARKSVQKDIPIIIKLVEAEFRSILGVEES